MASFLLFAFACGKSRPTPQQALETFRISENFTVDVFLAEPQIVDPVEMAWDEDGRLYVAEMRDYPDDPPPGSPVRSRIRMLEDRDGDGVYERSTIYADQVLAVSGFMPWKGGLIVTTAPDIVWMKDNNGDGVADQQQVLWTGFPRVNQEARITNPRLAIDNWIYCSNEGREGRITSPIAPSHAPVMTRGGDFRFQPVRNAAEMASGPAQYGSTFDTWGNRFITQNTNHLRHVVLPMNYLARAPYLDPGAVSETIYEGGSGAKIFPLTGPQHWRVERTRLRQERYNENQLNRTEHVGGYFSAASGGTVYTGDAFPREYVDSIFTGDVNGNLVHRDVLTPSGVTFTARAAKPDVEFLASTDSWFRPVHFANAPDGNFYVLDIRREFIETPESIPEELRSKMNFYAGDTEGRIFRIRGKPVRNLQPKLGKSTTAELVVLLDHPNGWHRDTARRLLLERQDHSAAPALEAMARDAKSPLTRAHALWALEGMGDLKAAHVERALADADPRVREHAVRMAEPFLSTLGPRVTALAGDTDRVAFQSTLTLGNWSDPRARTALVEIGVKHGADRWFRGAIASSASQFPAQLMSALAARGSFDLAPQLASLIGSRRDPAELAQALNIAAKSPKPDAVLIALDRGLTLVGAKSLRAPAAEAAVLRLVEHPSEAAQNAAWNVARHFELRAFVARALKDAHTVRAIRALRGGAFPQVRPALEAALAKPDLQAAAIDSLSSFDDAAIAPLILKHWRGYAPAARPRAITALLATRPRMDALIAALEQGTIELAALDIAARSRLGETGARAKNVLRGQDSDRVKAVDQYKDAIRLKGDVARGRTLFDENCARCHLPRKQGGRVGPDLSGINNKTRDELLASILNPSYSIEARFTNYIVTTKDGRMHDGVIASETPAVVVLRGGSEDGDDVILRSQIAEMRSSAVSLMPDELEKTLSKQGIADVIAYLRGGI